MRNQLTLEIIRAILHHAEEHSRLAKSHYNASLVIAFLCVQFINNAGKQLQSASQQLNQTLDNLDQK